MPAVLINIPDVIHADLKRKALTVGKSLTAMILEAAQAVHCKNDNEYNIFITMPVLPSINHSQGIYNKYELKMASNVLQILDKSRLATLDELKKKIKPALSSILIRILQALIQDGFIKYDSGQFIFVKSPH